MPSSFVGGETNKLPEEYFKQNNFTPEMRKEIEENFAKLNKATKSPFAGQKVKMYYYPGKGTDQKIQQDDCKNKNGKYSKI